MVFCDSRSRVERLALLLGERGVDTFVSHSFFGVEECRAAEQAFSQLQNCVIVATSSLELGLNVGADGGPDCLDKKQPFLNLDTNPPFLLPDGASL